MTPEKRFETSLVKHLIRENIFAHHFDAIGRDGWPDLICLCGNNCYLIECKYNTEELRIDQKAFHFELVEKYEFTNIMVVSDKGNCYSLSITQPDGCYLHFFTKTLEELVTKIAHYMRGVL